MWRDLKNADMHAIKMRQVHEELLIYVNGMYNIHVQKPVMSKAKFDYETGKVYGRRRRTLYAHMFFFIRPHKKRLKISIRRDVNRKLRRHVHVLKK